MGMTRKKQELSRTFYVTNKHGKLIELYEYTTLLDATCLSDKSEVWIPASKTIRTAAGQAVNVLANNQFQVVATGELLYGSPPSEV